MKRASRGAIWAQPLLVTAEQAQRIRAGERTSHMMPISKRNTRLSRGNWEVLCANPPWHSTPIGTVVARSAFEGVVKPVTLRCLVVVEQLLWLNDGRSAHTCRATPPALWVKSVEPVELAGLWTWHVKFVAIKPSVDEALRDAKSGLLHHWIPR